MVPRKETRRRDARALKTSQQLWENYQKLIPKSASETQLRETKKAFYAGLSELLHAFDLLAEVSDEKAVAYIKRIDKEITQFWEEENERSNLPKKSSTYGSIKDHRT